jgi:hypothetical protein
MAPWNPHESAVDYFLLDGKRSPGVCEITGASSPRKLDERGGYGLSGSTVVFAGVGLAKWSVKLFLWLPEHWAAWSAWRPLVAKPPVGSRGNHSIWHPLLEGFGIASCIVETEHQPEPEDDLGTWSITIDFKQYRAPKIALSKPEGAAAENANDPVQAQIEAVSGQNQEFINKLARGDVNSPLAKFPFP